MTKVLTIGYFDGVHRGHQKLINQLTETAQQNGMTSVVITYNGHPAYTLRHLAEPMLLTSTAERLKLLRNLGVDELDLIEFDQDFAQTSATEFLNSYLLPYHDPKVIVVGFDSHFGRGREGNFHFLKKHCQDCYYELIYVEPELYEDQPISSSLIRKTLKEGRADIAAYLLGRPYSIEGRVVHGKALGKSLGFPTANLAPLEPNQLLPKRGIYLSKVDWQGQSFFGLTNLGISPTVKQDQKIEIETYMLDFDQEIYTDTIKLSFLERLRDEKTFGSLSELTSAMHRDLDLAKELIEQGNYEL